MTKESTINRLFQVLRVVQSLLAGYGFYRLDLLCGLKLGPLAAFVLIVYALYDLTKDRDFTKYSLVAALCLWSAFSVLDLVTRGIVSSLCVAFVIYRTFEMRYHDDGLPLFPIRFRWG